jgi:outer membrane protein assembly factor BamE (lipoprotein component of BamABCDE complex)
MMIYAVFLTAISVIQPMWQNPDKWQSLNKAMTEAQIRQTLGNPSTIKQLDSGQVWYYSDTALVKLKYRVENNRKTLFYFDSTPPDPNLFAAPQLKPIIKPQPVAPIKAAVKPQIVKPAVAPSPPRSPGAAPAAGEPAEIKNPDIFASRFMVWGGGAIIVIAVMIAISQGAKMFP